MYIFFKHEPTKLETQLLVSKVQWSSRRFDYQTDDFVDLNIGISH